jgi:hypothetical protein
MHNAAPAEYDRRAALRIRTGPSNPPAAQNTTFKESVSVIKITGLTILSLFDTKAPPSKSYSAWWRCASQWSNSLFRNGNPVLPFRLTAHSPG